MKASSIAEDDDEYLSDKSDSPRKKGHEEDSFPINVEDINL